MRIHLKNTLITLLLMAFALAACAGMALSAWADEVDEAESSAIEAAREAQGEAQSVQPASANSVGDIHAIDLGSNNYVNPQQLPDSSFIYDATIADLASADSYLGGQNVQIVGEVVGDCINAELDFDSCWIVLADAEHRNVSVYMLKADASKIDTFGRYGQIGTQLQVRGEFRLVCPDHEGQTDIHATHVSVVKKGEIAADEFRIEDFIPGVVVVAIGLLMALVFHFMRERLR